MTDTRGAGAEQEVQTFKGAVSLGAGRGKTHSGSCHRLGGNFRPTAKEKVKPAQARISWAAG